MSCPQTGPCTPFITELDLCCLVSGGFPNECTVEGQPITQEKIDGAIQSASELLWAATGRKFGTCQVTIRPCQQGNGCDPCPDGGSLPFGLGGFSYSFGGFPWYPQLSGGVWTNISCPSCVGQCGCEKLCEIDLPYPVCCIIEVVEDGIILDETMYRVDDFRKLVRLDPTPSVTGAAACWPTCQDLSLPDTEEGTFSVTLTYGREVPFLVKQATAALACEFLKSCVGAPCLLPQRISSLTRQGVTVGFLDTMAFLEKGRTGIYLVDLAIATFNPYRLLKQASVYSIDAHPKWRLTDTAGDCP